MADGQFQGPVRPGTDLQTFRETGRSVPPMSIAPGGGGGGSAQNPDQGFTPSEAPVQDGSQQAEIAEQMRQAAREQAMQQAQLEAAQRETERQQADLQSQVQQAQQYAQDFPVTKQIRGGYEVETFKTPEGWGRITTSPTGQQTFESFRGNIVRGGVGDRRGRGTQFGPVITGTPGEQQFEDFASYAPGPKRDIISKLKGGISSYLASVGRPVFGVVGGAPSPEQDPRFLQQQEFTQAPSKTSRFFSSAFGKARQAYAHLFEPEEQYTLGRGAKTFDRLGPTKVATDVARLGLITAPTVLGQGVGAGVEYVTKLLLGEEGKVLISESKRDQLIIAGKETIQYDPYTGEEVRTQPFIQPEVRATPTGLGEVAKFGTDVAFLKAMPLRVLLGGGLLVASAKTLPREERIMGGVLAGFGLAGSALRGVRRLREPVIELGPKSPTAFRSRAFINVGPESEISRFGVLATTPERLGTVTTLGRRLTFRDPLKFVAQPRSVRSFYAPEVLTRRGEILEPVFGFERREGARFLTGFEIAGREAPFSIKNIRSLSRNQQLIAQRIAEAKAGVPVSIDRVQGVLGKDFKVTRGILESTKRGRFYPDRPSEVMFFGPGRRRAIGETFSIARKVEVPFLGGRNAEFYKTLGGLKDISRPLSRATGDIPLVRGETIVRFAGDRGGDQFFRSTGTRLSRRQVPRETLATLGRLEVAATRLIPRPRTIIPKPRTSNGRLPVVLETPRAESEFAGLGLYERTDSSLVGPSIIDFGVGRRSLGVRDSLALGISPRERLGARNVLAIRSTTQPLAIFNLGGERVVTRPTTRERARARLRPAFRLAPRTLTRARAGARTTFFRTTPRIRTPTTRMPIYIDFPRRSKRRLSRRKREDEFALEFRRGGEFSVIGKFRDPLKAIRKGKTRARKTLGTSLRIRETRTGRLVPLMPTAEFRLGKGDAFTLVQRASRRLADPLEVREIKGARRSGTQWWR